MCSTTDLVAMSHTKNEILQDNFYSFPCWAYVSLQNNQEVLNNHGFSVATLTFSKYQKILQDFLQFKYSDSSMMYVWERHKDVPFKTLRDIWYQEMKRLAMENHGEKFNKRLADVYYKEYVQLRSAGEMTFCIKYLADKYQVNAALMAKLILQHYLSHHYASSSSSTEPRSSSKPSEVPKWMVKVCFTDLLRCPDSLLAYDIWRAQLGDMLFGVRAHRNKRSRGYSYEHLIEQHLRRAGIDFSSEDDLMRDDDVKKTPDFLLTPCILLVRSGGPSGKVEPAYIHWIESKGLFGEPDTHHTLCRRQYAEYVHHYGPGLIIYWTGYVREMKTSFLHNVYVTNYLPRLLPYDCDTTTLTSLPPPATSTSLPPATTSLPPTTSTSLPPTTSTSLPPTTSTSLPPTTSTSLPPATTSTSLPPTTSTSPHANTLTSLSTNTCTSPPATTPTLPPPTTTLTSPPATTYTSLPIATAPSPHVTTSTSLLATSTPKAGPATLNSVHATCTPTPASNICTSTLSTVTSQQYTITPPITTTPSALFTSPNASTSPLSTFTSPPSMFTSPPSFTSQSSILTSPLTTVTPPQYTLTSPPLTSALASNCTSPSVPCMTSLHDYITSQINVTHPTDSCIISRKARVQVGVSDSKSRNSVDIGDIFRTAIRAARQYEMHRE